MDRIFSSFGSDEANNEAVSNTIEVTTAEKIELKFHEKLTEHKDKTDTKIEKYQDKTEKEIEEFKQEERESRAEASRKIVLLEEALEFERRARSDSRERRTAEMNDLKKDFSDFKNITAQSISNLHEHLNIVDGRVTLLEVQMHEMIDHMSKKGTETARNIQLDKIAIYSKKLCYN